MKLKLYIRQDMTMMRRR